MFKSTLEENKYCLNIIEQILTASLNLSSDSQIKLSLFERIKKMRTAKEILTNNEHLSKLDVFKPMMREHLRITDVLHSNCVTTWRKQIEWLENDIDSPEMWRVKLKITGSQEDISDSVLALQYFDSLNVEVKLFADKLIDLIIKPIIIQDLQVDIVKSVHTSTIILKPSNSKNEFFSTTIKKLKDTFQFLNTTLPVNINEVKIMSFLGSYSSQSFLKVFKEIALFNALPVQYNQLDSFREKLPEVLELNTYMCELGNTIDIVSMFILFLMIIMYCILIFKDFLKSQMMN